MSKQLQVTSSCQVKVLDFRCMNDLQPVADTIGLMGAQAMNEIPRMEYAVEILPMIKVYPNPVKSGTSVNIGCQKLKEGYYTIQLSGQSGQRIFSRQTWIDEEIQVLNIDIPLIAAGIYFLKLTNKETKKKFTEKITVE